MGRAGGPCGWAARVGSILTCRPYIIISSPFISLTRASESSPVLDSPPLCTSVAYLRRGVGRGGVNGRLPSAASTSCLPHQQHEALTSGCKAARNAIPPPIQNPAAPIMPVQCLNDFNHSIVTAVSESYAANVFSTCGRVRYSDVCAYSGPSCLMDGLYALQQRSAT